LIPRNPLPPVTKTFLFIQKLLCEKTNQFETVPPVLQFKSNQLFSERAALFRGAFNIHYGF